MENTRTFSVTIETRECIDQPKDVFGKSNTYGTEALEAMAEVLRAYGLSVDIAYTTSRARASVTIEHPEARDAQRLRNRGGGRPRNHDAGQTLEWFEGHSVEEAMKELGVSKRTYYRRLAEARRKCH